MTILRRLRPYIQLPFLPVILSPLVMFSPLLLRGQALFWGTPGLQFVPWWSWAWKTLLSGHLPLWNPLLGMGAPLLANYQSALFYPPNWIYFFLFAFGDIGVMAWGQALVVSLHLIWAGIGMIYLTRKLEFSGIAQTISGLSFSLSGYMVARAGFLSINSAAAWIPWVMLTALSLVTTKKRGKSVLNLGLVIGFQLLAGHAQITWYSLLLAGLWVGFWGFPHIPIKGHFKNIFSSLKTLFTKWLLFMTSLILGIAFSAIQLIPTAEYLLQSHRSSEVEYDFAMNYSFWPWRILGFIAPELFGNPSYGDFWGYANYWEDAVYIGLLPFLLAISVILGNLWSILFKRNHNDGGTSLRKFTTCDITGKTSAHLSLFLLGVILVSIILALGKNTVFFPWFYKNIPTFDMFQAPTRFTIWAEFSLALLAGVGANQWRRPEGRGIYWTRLGTMGAFAITLGSGIAWLVLEDIRSAFIRAVAFTGLWAIGVGLLTLTAPKDGTQDIGNNINETKNSRFLWRWLVALWVVVDLLIAHWGLNPGVGVDFYRHSSPSASFVHSSLNGGRLYLPTNDEYNLKFKRFLRFNSFLPEEDWINIRAVLLPNLNILDGIPSANNFDPLVPGRYSTWMSTLSEVDNSSREMMLNLMGVSVIERVSPEFEYGVAFYRHELGDRLRWVECAYPAADAEEALELVVSNRVDFDSTVVLEGDASLFDTACEGNSRASFIKMRPNGPNQTKVEFKANRSGWIVLSDTHYPGWIAILDGERVDIINANYLFSAVKVPPGEHTVQIEYRPKTFYLGAAISLITWISLIGLYIRETQWSRN